MWVKKILGKIALWKEQKPKLFESQPIQKQIENVLQKIKSKKL